MVKVKQAIKSVFGDEYKKEFKELFGLAWPIILSTFFQSFNFTISIMMCGHLSRIELDTVAISNSTLNIFGILLFYGMSTAMDTLYARTFGRGEKHKMFMLLMRFWILSGCLFILIASMYLHTESILLFLQQNALIAKLSSFYIAYYLPGLFFEFSFITFVRYLQNQNIVFPSLVFAICGNIFNAVSQYIAIYVLNYGYLSSAICQAGSSFVMFFTQFLYIIHSKIYKDSNFKFREVLTGWGFFFKLGIPGALMVGIEEWCFEIATIAAGIIGIVPLGVQSIMLQVAVVTFLIPLGISIALTIRVGQHLGAGSPQKARNSFRLSMALVFCTSIIVSILILSLSNIIPYAFTNDHEIIEQTSAILGILAFNQYIDGFSAIACGVMRSCGRQLLGAILNFVCYYIFCAPIGYVLTFVAGLEVKGMWITLAMGVSTSTIFYVVIACNTNWKMYSEIAAKSEIPFDSIVEVKECPETESWLKTEVQQSNEESEEKHEAVRSDPKYKQSIVSLALLRLLTVSIILIIFSVSLVIRLVRSEYCVPLSALDNSTDISRFSFVLCNETVVE